MNSPRVAYYPALFYALSLVLIGLASWLVGACQLFIDGETSLVSLLSGSGVRRVLLSVDDVLNAAPLGSVLFLLLMSGLLMGSGVLSFLGRLLTNGRVSRNEQRSFLFAFIALLLYCVLLFACTVSPWNVLMGVSGSVAASPLARGWLLLLFAGVLLFSLVYGFLYGNYRTLFDVVESSGKVLAMFVPALVAMLPASCIIPCLLYTRLVPAAWIYLWEDLLEFALYALPFVYIIALRCIKRG